VCGSIVVMKDKTVHKRPSVLSRDHGRPRSHPSLSDAEIESRLTDLISPTTYALVKRYHDLGLRERILTLPVMVALVLTMVWRQVPAVSQLVRMVSRDSLLWTPPINVSQKAFSLRLGSLPEQLFASVLTGLLPEFLARSLARCRPHPPVVAQALRRFAKLWIIDGSTLEALFRKVGPLRAEPEPVLGGKMFGLLDLPSKLPIQLWYNPDPNATDPSFLDRVKQLIGSDTLLLFDLGFYSFVWFDWLTTNTVAFVTRAKQGAAYDVIQRLVDTERVHDYTIQFGKYHSNPCEHPVRLVEVLIKGRWHRYLTNVLDPMVLSTSNVIDLYEQRWRIEDAFLLVKRLLGLAYLWTGSANGIALQIWATWLLYAVLVDLSDDVAEQLNIPLQTISFEMVYQGLYFFTQAHARGQADDPVTYLAAPQQSDLGIVKRRRKHRERDRLANRPDELDCQLDNPHLPLNF
jgi:hypothetical protein